MGQLNSLFSDAANAIESVFELIKTVLGTTIETFKIFYNLIRNNIQKLPDTIQRNCNVMIYLLEQWTNIITDPVLIIANGLSISLMILISCLTILAVVFKLKKIV